MQIPIIFSVVLNPEVLFRDIKTLFCNQISHLGGRENNFSIRRKNNKMVEKCHFNQKQHFICQSSIYLSITIEISHIMGHFDTNSCMKAKGINHYTTFTNFSIKYLVMCSVYTGDGGIK